MTGNGLLPFAHFWRNGLPLSVNPTTLLRPLRYMIPRFIPLVLATCSLISGCVTVGPDYTAPAGTTDAWSTSVAGHVQGSRPELEKWWKGFNDNDLDELIGRARSANRNLLIASQRINEARAQRGIARGQLFPTANAGGDYARTRACESLSVIPQENP